MHALSVAVVLIAFMAIGTVPAQAEPVSLIVAGINAVFATAFTTSTALLTVGSTTLLTVGQAIGAALAVGLAVASSALQGGGKRQGHQTIDPGETKQTFESAEASEIRAVGRVRIGGLQNFGNTKAIDSYRVISHCRGEIDGIESTFLGGREVVIEADGAVSSPPYAAASGGSYVYVYAKSGSVGETAWAELVTQFPGQWSAEHKGQGVAQTLVRYISPGIGTPKWARMFQQGFPPVERVIRGERVFDPRTNATAWSDNGILVALHVALTAPELRIEDFDLVHLSSEADRADLIVTTLSGTERRARASGVWSSEQTRGDTLRDLLISIGAEQIRTSSGKISFRLIDDQREPEATLTADDILSLSQAAGPEAVERPNAAVIKYYAPERNYEMTEIDLRESSWATIDDEIAIYGRKEVTFDLKFCPSPAQALRVGRRLFAAARADRGLVKTNFAGLTVWGARTIRIETEEFGEIVAEMESPRINDADGHVEFAIFEVDELDPWEPAVHEVAGPEQLPPVDYAPDLATPVAATAAVVVAYPDASQETRFGYPDAGAALSIEAVRRSTGPSPGAWQSLTEYRAASGFSMAYQAGALSGPHEFRHRTFDANEDVSLWSTVAALTPAVSTALPAAPVLVANEDKSLTLTAPGSLNLTSLVLRKSDPDAIPIVITALETIKCRPGEVFTRTPSLPAPGPSVQRVRFYLNATSAGGDGPTVTVDITIPPI
jgi:hypothetical protein